MKKLLFFVCAVLAIFGCGGDTDDLPCWGCWEKSSNSSGLSSGSSGSVSYGGQTYNTVKIGNQTWFAENSNSNCNKYGRLYDWSTAMAFPLGCNSNTCSSQTQAKHKGICPSGWHIPSQAETSYIGGEFSALPGGYVGSNGGFYSVSNYGYWWSASEYSVNNAYYRSMGYGSEYASLDDDDKSRLFSVRCVKD